MKITEACLNPHSDSTAFAIFCQLSLFVGILCNTMLLYGLLKDPLRCFRNFSSYLIMNNTFSDLLLCLYKFVKYFWRMCTEELIVSRLFTAPLYISFLSIFFLALDRCLIVIYPLKYRVLMKGKKAAAIIVFQWMFAFLNIYLKRHLERHVAGFRLISGIFMILSSCFLYVKTIYHLKKKAKDLDSQSGNTSTARRTITKIQKRSVLKQTRFLHTIVIITLLFIFTLSPLLVFDLVNENHGYGNNIKEHVHMCLYFLFYSNFVINSFVYYFRLTNYRRTFKLLFCCQSATDRN